MFYMWGYTHTHMQAHTHINIYIHKWTYKNNLEVV